MSIHPVESDGGAVSSPTDAAVVPFPLYQDALQCVMEWLSQRELHVVVQVSRRWHQLVNTMKPLSLSTECTLLKDIPLYSAVARHIAYAKHLELRSEELVRLSSLLPNVRETASSQFPWIPDDSTLILPHLLQSFTLVVSADGLSPLLAALSHLQNLQHLSLDIRDAPLARNVDFSRLQPHRLPQLRTFEIELHESSEEAVEVEQILSASLISVVRQMSLETLKVHIHKYRSVIYPLYRLLDELTAGDTPCPLTHSGNLTSIDMKRRTILDRALLQSIIKFPSLTKLVPLQTKADESDLRLLSRLPNLTELHLGGNPQHPLSDRAIIRVCRSCPHLRVLTLRSLQLDTAQLDEALSYLPELTSLNLTFCRKIQSLSPLINYGLPARLTELHLVACALQRSSDIKEYILQLKQLERLTIKYSFIEYSHQNQMPIEVQELIRPKTAKSTLVLPKLVESLFSIE